MMDLASERLGGRALLTSDDFFAAKENLLKKIDPIFIPDKYTDNGKWMDGWESRRKRGVNHESHDWCIVKLGGAGSIYGVDVDTAFFTGNFPESFSLEAAQSGGEGSQDANSELLSWTEIIPRKKLKGGSHNYFEIKKKAANDRWTHVRLKIFPDGGVARLHVYGVVKPLWETLENATIDLAGAQFGAVVVDCNDNYFGHKDNLIMPGRSQNMGDGWETRRKRGINENTHDWIVVRLGHRGIIKKIEVDTNFFKGNYPDSCLIAAADGFAGAKTKWIEILPRTKLHAHTQHFFGRELLSSGKPFTHVRLKIFPDGGVSRLRVNGVIEKGEKS